MFFEEGPLIPAEAQNLNDSALPQSLLEAGAPIAPARMKSNGTRAVAHTLSTRILQQGLNAGTGILAARSLLPSGRGQLAAMILWSLFLAGLTTFGIPTSLIYFTRKQPEHSANFVSSALAMTVLASLLAMLVAVYFLPSWLHQYPAWLVTNAQIFLLLTPVCSVTIVSRAVLEANGRFVSSNSQQLMVPALTLMGLLIAISMHHLTVNTAALAYTLPAIPALIWVLRQLGPLLPTRKQLPTLWACKTLLSYGIRSWGIDLLGTLGAQVDQVLVIRLLSPAEMGLYAVTLSLSRMIGIIQSSAVTVLFPKAAGLSPAEVVDLTGRATRTSGTLTVLGSLVVAMVGPWLLGRLYGSEYVHSVGAFRILLFEGTISGCAFLLSQAFMALGRPGLVTILQAIGLALSIPIMLWLIPLWGVFGAATALAVSTLARMVLVYCSFKFFLKISPPSLIPTLDDLRVFSNQVRQITGRGKGAAHVS